MRKPALVLTKDKLIDKFKGKEFRWSEIREINLRPNEGRAPGDYIAVYLNNSEEIFKISDIKLKGSKIEILDALKSYHNKYRENNETFR